MRQVREQKRKIVSRGLIPDREDIRVPEQKTGRAEDRRQKSGQGYQTPPIRR